MALRELSAASFGDGGDIVRSYAHAVDRIRMKVIPDAKTVTLKEFLITSISPGSEVVTDGFLAYRKATVGYEHTVHVVDGSDPGTRRTSSCRPCIASPRW